MAKPKKNKLVKTIKRISRENQLEKEKMIGRPRAKTFGGKPLIQQDRRETKKSLNRLDDSEETE
jgi:hypothetical protein